MIRDKKISNMGTHKISLIALLEGELIKTTRAELKQLELEVLHKNIVDNQWKTLSLERKPRYEMAECFR